MTSVAGWRFQERLLERDRIVYESVMSRNLPLVVTFGEGCGPHTHGIHYRFIWAILKGDFTNESADVTKV